MASTIHYAVRPSNPDAHLFEVTCRVPEPDPGGQEFRMPTWIPGSYLIREYARHVIRLSATSNDARVPVEKTAKDTWRCGPCRGELTLVYEVYAWDLSVRGAILDRQRGYFNGPAVFVEALGSGHRACTVEIGRPPRPLGTDWRVATAMPVVRVDGNGFGTYTVDDYEELLDHPVEMGPLAICELEARGVPHEVAVAGRHDADMDRIARDAARICSEHIGLFHPDADDRPPFDRYLFQVLAVGEGYGGLEHRASTSLLCKRSDLPRAGDSGVSDGYRAFLGLVSHEYFHTWLVKRIKPAAFVPYDLTRERYTRQLWVFEGFTSYYDDLALVRAGLITLPSYLELVGRAITTLFRGSGRTKQSLAESSFDAWIKFYRQDENAPNAIVSYYGKGALVALALDLKLRSETTISLDDVLREMWARYGRTGEGVPEDGVPALVSELAGVDLSEFFARYVYGTEDPPLSELFTRVGILLRMRAAEGGSDKGGTAATPTKALPVTLGAKLASGAEPELAHVYDAGPAQAAGLSAGDVLVALDGLRVKNGNLEDTLRRYSPGDTVRVHAFRRDELMELDVTLQAPAADTAWLEVDEAIDGEARARRSAWLRSSC